MHVGLRPQADSYSNMKSTTISKRFYDDNYYSAYWSTGLHYTIKAKLLHVQLSVGPLGGFKV